jgi:uncharacterized membrane protein required for colicin V production
MIAAAAHSASAIADNLSISWFDAVFVVMLVFGLFRGRRNGMSKELLPLVQWLLVVGVCGLAYPVVARMCVNYFGWGKALSDVTGYVALALVIFFIFAILKQKFTERLVAVNFFKGGEYYLGMMAGLVRFACVLLFALALMNAPVYSAADIAEHNAYVARTYGGGQAGFSGDFFPTFQSIQEQVFKKSFTGHYIKDHLGVLLINTTGTSGATGNVPAKKTPIIHIGN